MWTGSSEKPSGDWPREMRGTAHTALKCCEEHVVILQPIVIVT